MQTFTHDFHFDPTYGYDREALLQVPAPEGPDDFDAFWQEMYERARAVPAGAVLRPAAVEDSEVQVFDISFTSLGGVTIGGWLTLPRDGGAERGVVVGHGYGGREAPDLRPPIKNAAAIFPCARGMPGASRRPDIPDNAPRHVLHGIESRETYVHGGCAADIWCAASALLELVPEAASRLDYLGGSFGGGIGALALPWDERFQRAHLSVPSFGNHPLRLTMPCTGSGESVRLYHHDHPEVIEVLRYFDAATAARRLRRPTHIAAALFDPAVPPPGQFAVYNALPGPRELFVLQAGHFDYPDSEAEGKELHAALQRFFA